MPAANCAPVRERHLLVERLQNVPEDPLGHVPSLLPCLFIGEAEVYAFPDAAVHDISRGI
jgi:hypothetical protein